MTKDFIWGKGTPKWTRDAATNDSDKSFTVPAGKIWDLLSVQATMVNTATVGNRKLTMTITDGTDVVLVAPAGSVPASGAPMFQATGGNYSLLQLQRFDSLANATTGGITIAGLPIPCLLPAGYVVRVYDAAAIDAAADDMIVVLHYVEYDA